MADITAPEYISPYVVTTSGGLVLDRDVYTMPVGAASILQNFEPSVRGGYRRLSGTSRFSSSQVGSSSNTIIDADLTHDNSSWVHLVATWNRTANTMAIYINGSVAKTGTNAIADFATTANKIYLGKAQEETEPLILGDLLVATLEEMINAIGQLYVISPFTGAPTIPVIGSNSPGWAQLDVQIRSNLEMLKSQLVFIEK